MLKNNKHNEKEKKIIKIKKTMDLNDLSFFPSKILPERIDCLAADILDFLRQVNESMISHP